MFWELWWDNCHSLFFPSSLFWKSNLQNSTNMKCWIHHAWSWCWSDPWHWFCGSQSCLCPTVDECQATALSPRCWWFLWLSPKGYRGQGVCYVSRDMATTPASALVGAFKSLTTSINCGTMHHPSLFPKKLLITWPTYCGSCEVGWTSSICECWIFQISLHVLVPGQCSKKMLVVWIAL
jgi:hypothetical protein